MSLKNISSMIGCITGIAPATEASYEKYTSFFTASSFNSSKYLETTALFAVTIFLPAFINATILS